MKELIGLKAEPNLSIQELQQAAEVLVFISDHARRETIEAMFDHAEQLELTCLMSLDTIAQTLGTYSCTHVTLSKETVKDEG